jgi:hypothetical protein
MNFENYGPFPMPVDKRGDFTIRDDDASKVFFSKLDAEHPGLSGGRGCYVFAMRSARGTTPWYVGKAEQTFFGIECFNGSNEAVLPCSQRREAGVISDRCGARGTLSAGVSRASGGSQRAPAAAGTRRPGVAQKAVDVGVAK